MTVTISLILLTVYAAMTSLATEATKKFLDGLGIRYASNMLVLALAVIIGCGGTAIYYVNAKVPFTALNGAYLALMGVANWMGAMVGYDKVKQAISQVGANGRAGKGGKG